MSCLFFHCPVLECCVLPATRGVIDWDVCHFPVFSYQVGRLTVEVHHRKAFFTLEHIESPTFLGLKQSKKIYVSNHTRSLIHHKFKSNNLRLSYPRYPIPRFFRRFFGISHFRQVNGRHSQLDENFGRVRLKFG